MAEARSKTVLEWLNIQVRWTGGSSLRCGGRQGSPLRFDKLRERTKPFAAPWTAFLAAAGKVYRSC
jgi:hypothetical protein